MERRKNGFLKFLLIAIVLVAAFLFIGFRFLDQADERERRIFYDHRLSDGEPTEKKGYFIKPVTIWSVSTVDVSDESVKENNLLSKAINVTYVGSSPKKGYYNFSKDDGKTWYCIGGEDKSEARRTDKDIIDDLKGPVNDGKAYLYKTDPFISLFNTTWYIIPRGTNKAYPICRGDGTRIYTPTGDSYIEKKVKENILSGNKVDEKLFGTPEVSEEALEKADKGK